MIKAVIFDLDNTLVDFVKMKEEAVKAAVEGMIDAGLSMDRGEATRKIYEIYDREGIEYQNVFDQFLIESYGTIDFKILSAGIVAYRKAREASLVLYPHVRLTLVEIVKRGKKLAVISDAPRKEAWLRLCSLNIHHFFDYVLTFEDTGHLKPAPDPFEKALAMLGISPPEALMVGDWPERDIVGASKVGIKTVFAKYGDTFGIFESGADYEIDDIVELLTVIDEIEGNQPDGREYHDTSSESRGDEEP
ncbi:MAG: TIGR02253 family HAD-type hydrolase [Candidatus Glassbacteria bacterium]